MSGPIDGPTDDTTDVPEMGAGGKVPDLYICPTSGETESRTLGGFDVCCDHPRCPSNLYTTT